MDTEIDWINRCATFYVKRNDQPDQSLNQSVDNLNPPTLSIPINTAMEILNSFKWIEEENERRIQRLFGK
jgi:hypothetical protein